MQAHVITIQLKNKYNVISDTKQSMQQLGIAKYPIKEDCIKNNTCIPPKIIT